MHFSAGRHALAPPSSQSEQPSPSMSSHTPFPQLHGKVGRERASSQGGRPMAPRLFALDANESMPANDTCESACMRTGPLHQLSHVNVASKPAPSGSDRLFSLLGPGVQALTTSRSQSRTSRMSRRQCTGRRHTRRTTRSLQGKAERRQAERCAIEHSMESDEAAVIQHMYMLTPTGLAPKKRKSTHRPRRQLH